MHCRHCYRYYFKNIFLYITQFLILKNQADIIFFLASNQTKEDFKPSVAVEKNDSEFTDTDVNVGDDDGRSPLMYAAHKGHVNIVELLIKYGANIDIRYDKTGATPLDLAIFNGI